LKMYFSGSKAPTYFQENFGAFFVLVAFSLKLLDVWCYPKIKRLGVTPNLFIYTYFLLLYHYQFQNGIF
ncbi:hypothetical protein P9Z86_32895, partial [Bacillus thuringiensis]|uniref:hypothetical protein n=1 Tax=Bacillus thuringiensis TaxID=1428 RepID=UPI002DBA1D5D